MTRRLDFTPILSRLLRHSGFLHDLKALAEAVELSPAECIPSPALISLPGESDRATGTMPHTTLENIRRCEPEGAHPHGATIAYGLRGAKIIEGCTYGALRYDVGVPNIRRRPVVFADFAEYEEAQLSTDISSEIYFGHWLCDGLCTEILAEDRGLPPVVYDNAGRLHEDGYRQIFGTSRNAVRYVRFRTLWVIDDRGMNSARRERFGRLRDRALARGRDRERERERNELVFIRRGGHGSRGRLINEDEIAEVLSRYGFSVVDPMTMSADDIVTAFAHCRIAVGMEGSHQSHALMAMPAGGALLTLQNPQRLLHSWKFFGDVAGIRNAFVVGSSEGENFSVAPERVLKTLDLVHAAI